MFKAAPVLQHGCPAFQNSKQLCFLDDAHSCEPSACASPSKASGASSDGCFVSGDRDCANNKLPETSSCTCSKEEVDEFFCDENVFESSLASCHSKDNPIISASAAALPTTPADGTLHTGQRGSAAVQSATVSAQHDSDICMHIGLREPSSRSEVLTTIRNEQRTAAEVHPLPQYLNNHGGSSEFITPQMRMIVTSWLVEVASEYGLHEETLFLSVALLDRFLSSSQAVPRGVLQLVAVACMFLAAKHVEVSHPTVEELTDIAANSFGKEDLLRMERILLDTLDWRIKTATSYSMLQLFLQADAASAQQPQQQQAGVAALAGYLLELAMLDYGLVGCPASSVAGAALLLAQAQASQQGPRWDEVAELAGVPVSELQALMQPLAELQSYADMAHLHDCYQPLAFVRDKFLARQPRLASAA